MMRDLIYREAAIAALGERPTVYAGNTYGLGCRNQFDTDRLAIETVPPVDAVPVVRCRDCKYYELETGTDEYALGWCPFIKSHLVLSKGFCFWGKRKGDGNKSDGNDN